MKRIPMLLVMTGALLLSRLAAAVDLPGPLVQPEWLEAHRGEVTLLDVRKDVKSFTAQARLARDKKTGKLSLLAVGGHIPGAALVDYGKLRADRIIDGRKVEKLIPEKADFAALMQAAGVRADRPVVIVSKGVDNGDLTMATRLYWQLKYYGKDDLAILDGGMARWLLEQRPVTRKAEKVARGDWVPTAERDELLATSEEVEAAMKSGSAQLVDNRPLAQYLGVYHKSYVYADGHIPGARLFANELMNTPGAPARFLDRERLARLHEALGIKPDQPAITYCNSGHLASGGWFVLHELLGNPDVQLYDGSMHEWTLEKRPTRALVFE